jgi:hypothetical protein
MFGPVHRRLLLRPRRRLCFFWRRPLLLQQVSSDTNRSGSYYRSLSKCSASSTMAALKDWVIAFYGDTKLPRRQGLLEQQNAE